MLTNALFPTPRVHRSHIFQASWDDEQFQDLLEEGGLELTKNSPKNMLLLHDNVECKYDRGQLLIEYVESSQQFICRSLDQRIASEIIFPHTEPVTFGDYDGKPLNFPTDSRPLTRLIRFRAIVNRMAAICLGYIGHQDYEHLMRMDDWTPLAGKIMDWSSKIPKDSHLYVGTIASPV
jgi:hypothetical protein